uniref:Uncharacterized protein n=1 Tax=Eutreptiella gymnastica TaxID=73025 RepID=A0A7S4C7S6_9EUGL
MCCRLAHCAQHCQQPPLNGKRANWNTNQQPSSVTPPMRRPKQALNKDAGHNKGRPHEEEGPGPRAVLSDDSFMRAMPHPLDCAPELVVIHPHRSWPSRNPPNDCPALSLQGHGTAPVGSSGRAHFFKCWTGNCVHCLSPDGGGTYFDG